MRILLIGSGSREHAIANAVKNSTTENELFCLSGATNPAIKKMSADYKIASVVAVDEIVDYARSQSIDLAIVGPEAPLEVGVADALQKIGVKGCWTNATARPTGIV